MHLNPFASSQASSVISDDGRVLSFGPTIWTGNQRLEGSPDGLQKESHACRYTVTFKDPEGF